MEIKQKLLWLLFALSCIGIGLYPLSYSFLFVQKHNLLSTKSWELLMSNTYMTAFYTHITSGGLALLTGWSQFLKSWRNKYLTFHRYLGYFYVLAVFASSISGFIISLFSTGGVIGGFGFGTLAVLWFLSNFLALGNIKKGKVREHEKWMIRNYGLTFSAVTLRIYLPIILMSGRDIGQALQIVSFLCWMPNIVVTEIFIQSKYGDGLISVLKVKQKKSDEWVEMPSLR